MIKLVQIKNYKANEIIIQQGSNVNFLIFVLEGSLILVDNFLILIILLNFNKNLTIFFFFFLNFRKIVKRKYNKEKFGMNNIF